MHKWVDGEEVKRLYQHNEAGYVCERGGQGHGGQGEGAEMAHEHGAGRGRDTDQQIHAHNGAGEPALLAHLRPHPSRCAPLLRVSAHGVAAMAVAKGPRPGHSEHRCCDGRRVHVHVYERLRECFGDRHDRAAPLQFTTHNKVLSASQNQSARGSWL